MLDWLPPLAMAHLFVCTYIFERYIKTRKRKRREKKKGKRKEQREKRKAKDKEKKEAMK